MDSLYNSIFGQADMITNYEDARRNDNQEVSRRDQGWSSSPRSARDKHVFTWEGSREIQPVAQFGQSDMVTNYEDARRNYNQEVKRRDQGWSSSPRSACDNRVSTWKESREIQPVAHLRELREWKSFFERFSPSRQDIIKDEVVKGWVKFLCEDLIDMGDYGRYPHQFEEIIDNLSEVGRPFAAKELVKRLSRKESLPKGQILHAIEISGDRSVIPELITMSYDVKNSEARRVEIYGTIGMLGGRSELAKMLAREQVKGIEKYPLQWAVRQLEDNPSVAGQVLTRKLVDVQHEVERSYRKEYYSASRPHFSDYEVVIERGQAIISLAGKFGDVSVAQRLVHMLERQSDMEPGSLFAYRCDALSNIARRLDNPAEIKEISDSLVEIVSQPRYSGGEHITPVIGELGKRLAKLVGPEASTQGLVTREDVKKLSKDLVHILFDNQRDKTYDFPSIANTVFTIERHLAEPDPFVRFFDWEKVNRWVSDLIAEELVEYRKRFKTSEDFDTTLVKIMSHGEVREGMRHAAAHALVKINSGKGIRELAEVLDDKLRNKRFSQCDMILDPIRDMARNTVRNVENVKDFVSKLALWLDTTFFYQMFNYNMPGKRRIEVDNTIFEIDIMKNNSIKNNDAQAGWAYLCVPMPSQTPDGPNIEKFVEKLRGGVAY